MSRIGKQPVVVPSGVKVQVSNESVNAEGPKGKLNIKLHPAVSIKMDGNKLQCSLRDGFTNERALHGLYRALVNNMVNGVNQGFEKKLEIVGVGYGAALEGKTAVVLTVGYSHKVKLPIPQGVTVLLPDATHITVSGPDKQVVGHFAAEIRKVRPPEPYKGTGIKYATEVVRRKAGKAFGSAGG